MTKTARTMTTNSAPPMTYPPGGSLRPHPQRQTLHPLDPAAAPAREGIAERAADRPGRAAELRLPDRTRRQVVEEHADVANDVAHPAAGGVGLEGGEQAVPEEDEGG